MADMDRLLKEAWGRARPQETDVIDALATIWGYCDGRKRAGCRRCPALDDSGGGDRGARTCLFTAFWPFEWGSIADRFLEYCDAHS